MKRNKIILGSALLVAVAAIFAVSPWSVSSSNGTYSKKSLSSLEPRTSGEDAKLWLEARYIDQETGEKITPEKLELIRKQVRAIKKNKNKNI